jgi:hypothetical protein
MMNRLRFVTACATDWCADRLAGRQRPFIGGLVLGGTCNRRCAHCSVAGGPDLTWEQVVAGLDAFRGMGIRALALTGGEPFLWQYRGRSLDDVVAAARDRGFRAISVYTNGMQPIRTRADAAIVSLDGPPELHVRLRGAGAEVAFAHATAGEHGLVVVNSTINRVNLAAVPRFARWVATQPNLRGVFFFFHTPAAPGEALALPWPVRRRTTLILDALRRSGLPVLNSRGALRSYRRDDWERPSSVCWTWAYGRLFRCCREVGNGFACANCGYLGYLEVQRIVAGDPSAIIAGLAYVPRQRP